MANEFLHPEVIVAAALGVLERELVLPQFVTRLAESDFRGNRGDTITLRVPAYLEARNYEFRNDRTNPIELDEIQEVGVRVVLDQMPYSAVALTDENLTLDILNFGEQVLGPQVRACARAMEQAVATVIDETDYALTVSDDDPFRAVALARAELNKASIPMDNRALLLGADVETAFLTSPLLVRVDTSGSDRALRDAFIGRIAGMDTYVSQFIDPSMAYAIHRSAFAMANIAPIVPDGAPWGTSQTYGNYALRWIRDYDPMFLRDRSVLSSMLGCASVNDGQQYKKPGGGDYEGQCVRACKIEGIGA